jgi:dipeptidyl aminopeptidase/acylaminoacyl peptidase
MIDERERFERAFELFQMQEPPLERLIRRRDRKRRNQRIVTAVVALVLAAVAIGGAFEVFRPGRREPAKPTPTPIPVYRHNGEIAVGGGLAVDPVTGTSTFLGPGASSIAWSPDGSKLAYVGSAGDGVSVLDVASRTSHMILACHQQDCPTGIAWSPHGSRLALVEGPLLGASGRSPMGGRLELIDPDGRHRTMLVQLATSVVDISGPTWSPDGRRIAFAVDSSSDSRIYQIDANGSDLNVLHDLPRTPLVHGYFRQNIFDPGWSPNGSQIAYLVRVPGAVPRSSLWQVWIMEADGSHPTRIFQSRPIRLTVPGPKAGPVWSPDGTMIAFAFLDGLHVMRPDGTDDHVIAPAWVISAYVRPAWRPVP